MRRNLRCGARAAFPAPGRPGWHHGAVEQRLSLVTLGVADLARSRAFYEALGWTTRAEPDDDVVFFQAGGMIVGGWPRTDRSACLLDEPSGRRGVASSDPNRVDDLLHYLSAAAQDKQLTPAADAAARLSETIAGVQPTT